MTKQVAAFEGFSELRDLQVLLKKKSALSKKRIICQQNLKTEKSESDSKI